MTRYHHYILSLLLCLLIFAPTENTRADDTITPDALIPTSGWLIGPATLRPDSHSHDGVGLPCIMLNQYHDSTILRFSANQGHILAVAIDFRKDVFEKGRQYELSIEIPPSFQQKIIATAYNDNTILFNTPQKTELYEALKHASYLHLGMGNLKIIFTLPGIQEGLARLDQCYQTSRHTQKNVASTHREEDSSPLSPTVYVTQKHHDPAPDHKLEARITSVEESLKKAEKELSTLQSTPKDAAARPPAPQKPENTTTTTPTGSSFASTLLSSMIKPKDGMRQSDIMITTTEQDNSSTTRSQKQWRVIKGRDLHEILDVWTRYANVQLLWHAKNEYTVVKSISLQGSFEEAVAKLLEQYQVQNETVTGRIYMDSALNQKVLVIKD